MVRAVSIGAGTLLAMVTVAAGCGSSGGGGTAGGGAGTSGAAGTSGNAGTTGTAGTTGAGGGAAYMPTCAALVPTAAPITDFSGAATSFGPYDGAGFSGAMFTFPPAVTQSFTSNNWNVTGTVADYSGFGVSFQCLKANVSAYQGIQFDISGTYTAVAAGGTAPATSVTFSIGTVPDDVASQYTANFNANDSTTFNFGTCVPAGSQYDGSCAAPSKAIPFTAIPTTVMVHWTDLAGAKPHPFDPTQITSLAWALPWGGTGSAQYTVNVTIDNLSFF